MSIGIPKDLAAWCDPKTGQLTKPARMFLVKLLDELNGKVSGPDGAVDGNFAVFNGDTGKEIRDGGP